MPLCCNLFCEDAGFAVMFFSRVLFSLLVPTDCSKYTTNPADAWVLLPALPCFQDRLHFSPTCYHFFSKTPRSREGILLRKTRREGQEFHLQIFSPTTFQKPSCRLGLRWDHSIGRVGEVVLCHGVNVVRLIRAVTSACGADVWAVDGGPEGNHILVDHTAEEGVAP